MKVLLKKTVGHRVLQGHPWIFSNEIAELQGEVQDGGVAEVFTHQGSYLGTGYYNSKSRIQVRLLSRNRQESIDNMFFLRRLRQAWAYRQQLGYTENCRLIFAEADDMPALIIDKFNDYFVLQTLALGMDVWKPAIVAAIQELFHPKGIYERNDVPVRELEGLSQVKGFLSDPFDTRIQIRENGLKFWVDLEHGQKTGYFLDQQDNRREIARIVSGAEVLDAFSYTGTFSCHAARYGARKVQGLDISEQAIALCRSNAALNGLEQTCSFEVSNAFDVLKAWGKEGRSFDVVMLDPPAFTKSRDNIHKAITGYKEINLRGLKLVRPGGFLVTSSCTNLVSPALFLQTIDLAASDARRRLRQVCFRSQSADHPIVWGVESTHYLKFLIVQVL